MHNPRGHYNYLRLVSVHKYTVLVWFQYCVIIMNEIGGMRRRRRRRYEQEEEEEQDEHTMEYNYTAFLGTKPKALLPGLFITLIRSINTPLKPS